VNVFGLDGAALGALAAAIACVPAIVTYVRGRRIARFVDDPALPERLFSGRHAASRWYAFTIVALIAFTGLAAIWAIPLAIVASAAAGLPLRRILYNETWSLASFLSIVIRFIVATWGFWVLVAALPTLALSAGERAGMVALGMGAALMAAAARQADVIRWLIGARPIADEAIRVRFARLVAASGLTAPHFEVVDLTGGSFANAFALPSFGRGSVVFTGPLLERLDADETDAICAHELAHLEHQNPRRFRQRRLISRSLVIGGALLTPLLQYVAPSAAWFACAAWPVVVLIAIAALSVDQQKHEKASDLRAVALTGNPEALVSALVKMHAIARIPRRWDAELERQMSHPSLERRIQDIRAAAGTAPAMLGDASVFESPDGAARVVFGAEHLEWIEGASASYRLRYDWLGELRVAVTRTGETSLAAADRAGHRWQMPVRVDEVTRMQAVLDIVDARLHPGPPAATIQPVLVRAAMLTVLIVALNSGLLAAAMVLAIAVARPEAPLVCAAGLAAVGGAALSWRDPGTLYGFIPEGFEAIFAGVLLAGGSLLVWLAYARRRDEVPVAAWKLTAVVGVAALISWLLPIATYGVDVIGLHQAARAWASSTVLPLALAGALMWSARRALRVTSALAAAASIAAAIVGSQGFLDRFGGDLFLVPAPEVTVRTLDRPLREFSVPFGVSELHLSPGGRSIAAIARGYDARATVHVGRAGEALTAIEADGALFIDDDRVLVWTVDGNRTDLRELVLTAPDSAGWQLRVTGLPTPAVSLDPKSRRWRLAGRAGLRGLETREGVVGTEQITSYRWRLSEHHGLAIVPIALSGDRALVIEPQIDLASPVTDPLGALVFAFASGPRWRSTLWALGPDGAADLGTSRLEVACHAMPVAERGVCHIFDASRTRFFAMDARTRAVMAVASLPGRFFVGEQPHGAWIAGWYQSGPIAVRLAPLAAIRVAGRDGVPAHLLAVSDRAAAGVWYQAAPPSSLTVAPMYQETASSRVRIYAID
jgi:Zn-dependent protease with chaperone function